MFIKTAKGTSLLTGSIVNIEATRSDFVPASEGATRPDGAAACIIVDALRDVRTDYAEGQLSAEIDRYVLGWFETQEAADAELVGLTARLATPLWEPLSAAMLPKIGGK